MRGVLTICHLTLSEARRRRIVTAAMICAAVFLVVFGTAMFFAYAEIARDRTMSFVQRQGTLTILTLLGLFAANFLSVLLAVLLPVDALSGEIDSGVMQTLAAKPIRRADIVLGKWLGHGLIVVTYLTVLCTGVLLIMRVVAHFSPINIARALPLMLLEVMLLVSISIAGGTKLSTVTNGIAALGFFGLGFVGGLVELIGGLTGIQSAKMIGIVISLLSPSDAMWRLASYFLQPPLVRGVVEVPFFASAAIPSPLMVWWAMGYLVLALVFAVRSFERRAL